MSYAALDKIFLMNMQCPGAEKGGIAVVGMP